MNFVLFQLHLIIFHCQKIGSLHVLVLEHHLKGTENDFLFLVVLKAFYPHTGLVY